MQTWAILAAKHAALTSGIGFGAIPAAGWDSLDGVAVGLLLASVGFAAVSGRRVHGCPIPPVGAEAAADGGNPAIARASRIRRRVDGLLTGMLSDDADKLASAAAGGRNSLRPADAAEKRFEAPATWRGDYVDALPGRRTDDSHPYPELPAAGSSPGQPAGGFAGQSPAATARSKSSLWLYSPPATAASVTEPGSVPWPWLTPTAAVDGEQLWPLAGARPGDAAESPDTAGALAVARDDDDVVPLPPPDVRRREAVQRFMAAPVVDLDTVREERARELARGEGRPLAAGAGRSVPGEGAAEPGHGSEDGDEAAARRWSGGPGKDGPEPGDRSVGEPASAAGGSGHSDAAADDGADSTSGTSAADKPSATTASESFWGPRGAVEDVGNGHRSRHRPDGAAKDKPQDGRRARPRHAAPPASFGATLSRRLSGTRLTSRSAAHAG
jgi:hypothetical protein